MTIYNRIKEKADEKGISIKALEREAGLGNGVIKRWNETSPQCNKLELVANYLQVSIEWLITGKNPSNFTKEESELIQAYKKADARGDCKAESSTLYATGNKIIRFTDWIRNHYE